MDPLAVSKSERFWTVRFRPADEFAAVQMPEWAQRIAREISRRANVRLGEVGTSALVEVVRVSRYRHPDRVGAVAVAEKIAEAVES
jgi:hypothetical protein